MADRALTAFQNFSLGVKLSEYHTWFRAFSRDVMLGLPLLQNSDDFLFHMPIYLWELENPAAQDSAVTTETSDLSGRFAVRANPRPLPTGPRNQTIETRNPGRWLASAEGPWLVL